MKDDDQEAMKLLAAMVGKKLKDGEKIESITITITDKITGDVQTKILREEDKK